jgi:asparagine synthase (glutamine-hydrolysing)
MPGFAGVLSADPALAGHLDLMCSALTRRDEDAHGAFRCPEMSTYVSWIDRSNSDAGVRPIWNEARDVALFLYGEIHADQDCSSDLRRRGHRFGDVGAEFAICLYEEYGPDFVGMLNGWFSGLLLDLRRHRAILFNDRFGVGRIYVKEAPAGLSFSSEAKSLLRVFSDSRQLDSAAVGESFAYGCVLRDRTLFQGITLMPAASRWTLEGQGSIRRESYFDSRTWEAQETLADERFYEQLRETFHRLLPHYVRGTGVAMSLTGGLDGRMIMAWARASAGSLPCYSFSGPFRECHDVRIARRIALECRQPHRTIEIGKNLLSNFPDLAAQCIRVSDGTMDVSGAVELLVNREARSLAPVRLTGNYGSEIVRGNVAFRPQRLRMENYEPSFARQISAANETYAAERRVSDLTFIAFKQVPWYHHARASVERSQLDTRSPFLDNALVALMYRASTKAQRSRDLSLRLIHDGDPRLANIPTDRAFRYGPVTIRDRLSQAILDFSAKAEYAYDYGMPDWLCKIDRAVAVLQPERWFLGRHKFYHFRTWYRRDLSEFVHDILLAPAAHARSFYRKGILEAIVTSHVRGDENHTDEIHRALTLELTHRLLVDDVGL